MAILKYGRKKRKVGLAPFLRMIFPFRLDGPQDGTAAASWTLIEIQGSIELDERHRPSDMQALVMDLTVRTSP